MPIAMDTNPKFISNRLIIATIKSSMLFLALLGAFCSCSDPVPERGARKPHITEEQEAELLNSPLEESSPIIEKARIHSPDRKLDAILASRLTHATVATPTYIYIVSTGTKVFEEPVFVGNRVIEPVVAWVGDRDLKVSMKKAQVFVQRQRLKITSPNGGIFDVHISFEVEYLVK